MPFAGLRKLSNTLRIYKLPFFFGLRPSRVQLKHHVSVARYASVLRHNTSLLGPIHRAIGLVTKSSSI